MCFLWTVGTAGSLHFTGLWGGVNQVTFVSVWLHCLFLVPLPKTTEQTEMMGVWAVSRETLLCGLFLGLLRIIIIGY